MKRKRGGGPSQGGTYVFVLRDESGREELIPRRCHSGQPEVGATIELPMGEFIVERLIMRDDPSTIIDGEQQNEDQFQVAHFYLRRADATSTDSSSSPTQVSPRAKVLKHPGAGGGTKSIESDFSRVTGAAVLPLELVLVLVAISYRALTDEYEEMRSDARTLIRVDADHYIDTSLPRLLRQHARRARRALSELGMKMIACRNANAGAGSVSAVA